MSNSSVPPALPIQDTSPEVVLEPFTEAGFETVQHEAPMDEWDALYYLLKGRQAVHFRNRIMQKTGAKDFYELLSLDSSPEDDYYRDLDSSDLDKHSRKH
ncbi:hypothetical protein JXD20_00285 [Candidatus Peregrinibacteria bacterium]|nr:hypothetical protein [Candidatus Peregrinibacteria bacterium]